MSSLIVLAVAIAAAVLALRASQASRTRRLALQRIGVQIRDGETSTAGVFEEPAPVLPVYPRRFLWAPVAAGIAASVLVAWRTDLPASYAIGFAVLAAAIVYLLEQRRADQQVQRMESQLADAIDLMVASLHAGSALVAAMEASLKEARQPFRAELESIVGRIRLGEDPREAVRDLSIRVPLESFRLFTYCLLVHWETGGSLAGSLRTVGRTVRDRIEVSRRIAAEAIESQVSVAAVMAIVYGLVVLMYHSNPVTYRKLIYSLIGSYIACGLMVLQSVGMVWIWRMSRIRF